MLHSPSLVQEIDEPEWLRLQELVMFEKEARLLGYLHIAGIDEAGRGPLAGPVVAAACIIPPEVFLPGINDSKLLTPKKRAELFDLILKDPRILYGIGIISHEIIDEINIYQATIKAMCKAVKQLSTKPDYLLVDGMHLPQAKIPSLRIVMGDSKSQSIGAASVIAKETRDKLMIKHHKKWPHYGFDQHKGYGTPAHLKALKLHGPCPIHRMSFEPVKNSRIIEKNGLAIAGQTEIRDSLIQVL
jgi:ribonuclease HII